MIIAFPEIYDWSFRLLRETRDHLCETCLHSRDNTPNEKRCSQKLWFQFEYFKRYVTSFTSKFLLNYWRLLFLFQLSVNNNIVAPDFLFPNENNINLHGTVWTERLKNVAAINADQARAKRSGRKMYLIFAALLFQPAADETNDRSSHESNEARSGRGVRKLHCAICGQEKAPLLWPDVALLLRGPRGTRRLKERGRRGRGAVERGPKKGELRAQQRISFWTELTSSTREKTRRFSCLGVSGTVFGKKIFTDAVNFLFYLHRKAVSGTRKSKGVPKIGVIVLCGW